MGWVSEFDIGEYFSSVGKSLISIVTKTGEVAGGVVGGLLGGIFKKLWFWLLLALIVFVAYLSFPIWSAKLRGKR
jgi:uncharacterized membrane protein YoaK (UPF0700 family)